MAYYEIKDLISEYNEELYKEISAQIKINLESSTTTWSAHINDQEEAIISCSKTEYPDACFAHELLHIKLELAGLKDPYIRSNEKDVSIELIRFIINQLAHHKFYSDFYDMGFASSEFLNDNDLSDAKKTLKRDIPLIEKIYKKNKTHLSGMIILMPYLITISPHETDFKILKFKNRIIKIADTKFIKQINLILKEWVHSERMDYCITLAKIFKACNLLEISFAPQNDTDNPISTADV